MFSGAAQGHNDRVAVDHPVQKAPCCPGPRGDSVGGLQMLQALYPWDRASSGEENHIWFFRRMFPADEQKG